MNVKILEVSSNELTRAIIKEGEKKKLPTVNEDWIFDFNKHAKGTKVTAYILVHEDTPKIIEGCMIYSIHESFGPYMNYLEVAPNNKGDEGKYKYVAGCLIAYACGLSFELDNMDKGILTFQAFGKNQKSTKKLEILYHDRYGAIKNPWGYMEIHQDKSKELIEEYLYREK
ncbi:MAG: hypothetical protein GQ574_25360 [Crocinitomix sp.]|nr:hypothetical protein [Crocinitomix sp.]